MGYMSRLLFGCNHIITMYNLSHLKVIHTTLLKTWPMVSFQEGLKSSTAPMTNMMDFYFSKMFVPK